MLANKQNGLLHWKFGTKLTININQNFACFDMLLNKLSKYINTWTITTLNIYPTLIFRIKIREMFIK